MFIRFMKIQRSSIKILILTYIMLVIITFSFFGINMLNEKKVIEADREGYLNNAIVGTNNNIAQTSIDIIAIKNMVSVLNEENDSDYYTSPNGIDETENLGINWLTLKQSYYELSIIGLDGNETIKIRKGIYDRVPYAVDSNYIDNDNQYSFFTNIDSLQNNDVVVSEFTTLMDEGEPVYFENELIDIYKIITPFYSKDDNNEKLGYIELKVFTDLLTNTFDQNDIEAINSDGYYIYSKEYNDSLYGFMLDENIEETYDKYNNIELDQLTADSNVSSYRDNLITYSKINKDDINKIITNTANDDINIISIGSLILINNTIFTDYSQYKNIYILEFSFIVFDLIIAYIITFLIDRRKKERRYRLDIFQKIADTDDLTGVNSRKKFFNDIKLIYNLSGNFSLLYCDLDGFKNINDNNGHDTGDIVLVEISKRIIEILPSDIYLYRVGGDEFIVLIKSVEKAELEKIATDIINVCSKPINIKSKNITLGMSIGISMLVGRKKSLDDLIDEADDAMYKSKNANKNSYKFY